MKLLLDTQAYLWWRTVPSRLNSSALEAIETEEDVALSSVSGFEIAVKQAIGKLVDDAALLDDPAEHDLEALPVTWAHAREMRRLPMLHRDPFDRLLIAQARIERRTLVTADEQVQAYEVATMPA
ncbi:MAG: type II toxin-antitoxin system VapC family toxin [Acidimicrobiales bacterium]